MSGEEMVRRVSETVAIPFAVLAPIVTLALALSGWNFTLNSRLTALETIAAAPSKTDAQIAAMNQKLMDFQEEYERDRINDRVVQQRETK